MSQDNTRVSTGRGGAGNIGKDDTVYTDGGIVREGVEGQSANAEEFSTGRGGAGNIGAEEHSTSSATTQRHDEEYAPETNIRVGEYSDFHTGRGGQGNVHKDKYGGHSTAKEQAGQTVTDKVKHMLHKDK